MYKKFKFFENFTRLSKPRYFKFNNFYLFETNQKDFCNIGNYNYDILSTSYYPFWHGDLTNLKNKFNYIEETYNKKF